MAPDLCPEAGAVPLASYSDLLQAATKLAWKPEDDKEAAN
jgi:hypothetical protein